VAAAESSAWRDVSVILLCERDSLQGDAALAARGWKYGVRLTRRRSGKRADHRRAVRAGAASSVRADRLRMIEAINATARRVLAVDLPERVTGRTGAVMGAAINAVETVDLLRRSPRSV